MIPRLILLPSAVAMPPSSRRFTASSGSWAILVSKGGGAAETINAGGTGAVCSIKAQTSKAFDQRGVRHSTRFAHGLHPISSAVCFQSRDQVGQQAPARGTHGVPNGDGAAKNVEALGGNTKMLLPGQRNRRESLVHFEQIDLVNQQSSPCEKLFRRRDDPGQHHDRVVSDRREMTKNHPRTQAESMRQPLLHDQCRRRAVSYLA